MSLTDSDYRVAFDLLPLPAILLGPAGDIVRLNAAANALVGAGHGEPWPGLTAATLGLLADTNRERVVRMATPTDPEWLVDVTLRRLPRGVLATVNPVAPDTAPDTAPDSAEERSRTLLASLPQRIFFKDPAGVFVSVNDLFAQDFGLSAAEMIGKTDADFFPPTLARKYRRDDQRILASGVGETLTETNVIGAVRRVVEVMKRPILSADGAVLGILGMFTDITDRTRIEEELAHERHLLHTLMDHMPDLIYFKDRASRFTRMNRAHAEAVAIQDAEQAVGKTDLDFFPEAQAREFMADEQRLMASGEALVNKIEILDTPEGGRRWNSSTKVPIRGADGVISGMVGISRDVTQRVRDEAELKRVAEDLARSNEDLQQFAYVASHDLQEPLRMVASYTQLLARRYRGRLDADADEFIEFAVDGAVRMQGLINDLLQYSRVGTRAAEAGPYPLGEAVEQARRNLAALLEETGASLEIGDLPTLEVDGSQMTQVFQNLISNGLKFRGEAAPAIAVAAQREPGEWVISVADNGIGIDPAYAERVFVIFQRLHTRAEYPGSGIGLAICKKVVTRHGGRIWVERPPAGGSVFRFTLPTEPPKSGNPHPDKRA